MKKANLIVENLFRHESGRIISRLSARYGMVHLSEIEDAVSDAMIRAIKMWGINDVPENPAAWLYSVASRILIDGLRRKKLYIEKIAPEYKLSQNNSQNEEDQFAIIKLMLWCAHPELSSQDQLGLILQLVSGFSIKEISSAFLVNSETLKKRLQRARAKLKSVESELLLPSIEDSYDRFPILRSAIYLGFNEGYYSISHENIIREDLIYEALRLTKLLCDTPHEDIAISKALMALILYHTSRTPARRSHDNSMILLEDQDRQLWNQSMINMANTFMEQSMEGTYYTPYHIEAIIAGIHTQTKNYKLTNWNTIAQLYKTLVDVRPNPIIELNYIFALLNSGAMREAEQAIKTINPVKLNLHQYLYYAVYSNIFKDLGRNTEAKKMLWLAIDTAPNDATRKELRKRMDNMV